ncbi:hypothetical protein [Mesorhizobium sp. L-2-11]|uniref:hypothetical protein n=1 Tax=Mesorhizobium sp. L-2-11 TaxID=2744521 RepID=UPI001935E7AE|nr:hypothetical protein [Mesorhizobium sp. L-2-11]BCH17682.1 hypothetical protein MesoLjLa_45330 [Mesorhizobium sp. L-2-11]
MSDVELYPGRVSPLRLGIPHADVAEYTGLELLQRIIDNKYKAPPLAFGTETCSIFLAASLPAASLPAASLAVADLAAH